MPKPNTIRGSRIHHSVDSQIPSRAPTTDELGLLAPRPQRNLNRTPDHTARRVGWLGGAAVAAGILARTLIGGGEAEASKDKVNEFKTDDNSSLESIALEHPEAVRGTLLVGEGKKVLQTPANNDGDPEIGDNGNAAFTIGEGQTLVADNPLVFNNGNTLYRGFAYEGSIYWVPEDDSSFNPSEDLSPLEPMVLQTDAGLVISSPDGNLANAMILTNTPQNQP